VELGRICGLSLCLMVGVPTFKSLSGTQATKSRFAPAATSELLEMAEEDASKYLKQQVDRMRREGQKVDGEVARGDPAAAITEAAHRLKADLILMGTHGRVGTRAFWSGSVAPAVFNRSQLPVLLVPLGRRAGSGSRI
jgi:nucleotide-binding universal stress UspA family protein